MPKIARNPAGQSRRVDALIDEHQANLPSANSAIVGGSTFESLVVDRGPSSSDVFRGRRDITRVLRGNLKSEAERRRQQAVKHTDSSKFPLLCGALLKAIAAFNADNAGRKTLTEHVLAELPSKKAAIEETNAKLRAHTSTTPSLAASEKNIARKPIRRKKPIAE